MKSFVVREVKAVTEMYNRGKAAVRLENKRSNWFDVNVAVYHGSVPSPLIRGGVGRKNKY